LSRQKPVKKIKARLLPDREQLPDETDEEFAQYNRLRTTVEEQMVHTPCEGNKEKAYCRKGCKPWWPKCSKRFPHDFLEETAFVEDGYVQLRRPNDGVTVKKFCKDLKKEVEADNRHVVAYSPYLLLKFKCHINVELTNSIRSCKYIFKYLFSK